MEVSYKNNELSIDGVNISFLTPISKVLKKENGVIVLLKPITGTPERNVFFVNLDGTIKWQIQHLGLPKKVGYQGYTGAGFDENGMFTVYSMQGLDCKIDIDTGEILEKIPTK